MVIDLDKCVACQACVVACAAENNQPIAGSNGIEGREVAKQGRVFSWMALISDIKGKYPNTKVQMLPRPCMHCDDPPCAKVCPVGARFKRKEDGIVLTDFDRCIGCRFCMVGCPYDVNYFNWREPKYVSKEHLNPASYRYGLGQVGPKPRPTGVVEKCLFCVHRNERLKSDLMNGKAGYLSRKFANEIELVKNGKMSIEELAAKAVDYIVRTLQTMTDEVLEEDLGEWRNWEGFEHTYIPACASTCPAKAIMFGDLDDPSSLVSEKANSPRAFRLLEELGTKPKVIYLAQG